MLRLLTGASRWTTSLLSGLVKVVNSAAAVVGLIDGEEVQTPFEGTAASSKPVSSDFSRRVGWRLEAYSYKGR